MAQHWYQKASVQASIAGGLFVLLAAVIAGVFGLLEPKQQADLQERLEALESRLADRVPDDAMAVADLDADQQAVIGSTVGQLEQLFEKGVRTSQAETFYRMGNYYFATSDYGRAVVLYEDAILLQPTWQKLYLAQGLSYEKLGKLEKALNAYRGADAIDPHPSSRSGVLLNIAATFWVREEFEQSRLYAQRAADMWPSASAYRLVAEASAKLGESEDELEALTRFVNLAEMESGESAETSRAKERIEALKALRDR